MALEQFKTQILLLHSERSTLAKLSAGFADRYTVHCATSGSEALNTLGETSIDIIVTAQELPGMSGLDALREAKKRSPGTKCFLLAGNEGERTEALVGADEVFQVVRGQVTPESLRKLIDDATRQARLMELTESANDNRADVDSPAEHIVMETAENGSSIITDATGRLPVLDPGKAAEANVGSRAVDVLVLTKDDEFLTTVRESARGMHTIIAARTLAEAESAVVSPSVGVAVVDAAMVGDNVEKLTLHLRGKSPRLVSIVAGRRDDGEMLMDLINRGKVYRFLLKPVSPGRARLAIEASAKHHLEAPDAAFKPAQPSGRASKPAIPAAPKKARAASFSPKPQPTPAAPPKQTKQATPTTADSQPVPTIVVEPRPVPVDKQSFDDDRLGDAFSGDDSKFTETMTGIIRTVGEKISSVTSRNDEDLDMVPMAANDPVEDSPDESFLNPKIVGAGTAVLILLAAAGWWLFSGPDEPVSVDENRGARPEFVAPDPVIDAADVDIEQELATAESALLARDLESAATALNRVTVADPNNARLPFLSAQLAQMQLRDYLDSARLEIRENRFEDAAIALNGARALAPDDMSEIELVSDELNLALNAERVDDLLAQALTEIDAGRFNAAESLLADARRLNPDSSALASATAALNSARKDAARRQVNTQQAEAERRAADQAAAKKLAAEQAEADRIAAEQRAEEESARTFAVAATAADNMTDEKTEIPADLPVTGSDSVTNNSISEAVEPVQETSQQLDGRQMSIVSASSLNRIKYVAPKYPRAAQRRNQAGWVEVQFTVDIDGNVQNVAVVDSEPDLTFVNAAVTAVEKWKFEPVVENGIAVQKRAAVRMMFAVE